MAGVDEESSTGEMHEILIYRFLRLTFNRHLDRSRLSRIGICTCSVPSCWNCRIRKIRDNCNTEFEKHWQCLEKNNQVRYAPVKRLLTVLPKGSATSR